MSFDYVSNQEIIQAARRNLPQDVWDYLTGGAESETTMRRNRLGFDCLGLRPRVLVDVSKVDTSTTFLGQKLRIPVMMAPIGSLQTITPEGGVGGGEGGGGVRHHELPQLGDPAKPRRDRRLHQSSENFSTLHSRRFGLVCRDRRTGEEGRLHGALPHRGHGALQPARAAAAQSLAAAQPRTGRPGASIRRCSPGRWPRRSKKSPACR